MLSPQLPATTLWVRVLSSKLLKVLLHSEGTSQGLSDLVVVIVSSYLSFQHYRAEYCHTHLFALVLSMGAETCVMNMNIRVLILCTALIYPCLPNSSTLTLDQVQEHGRQGP